MVEIILIMMSWLVVMPRWLSVLITVLCGIKLYISVTKVVMVFFKGASGDGGNKENESD